MTYVQKDLGYPRKPTSAMVRVTMPDGKRWNVPLQLCADARDECWSRSNVHTDTVASIKGCLLTIEEIIDSAYLSWDDAEPYAVRAPPDIVDYRQGWIDGPKTIVGEV